ncbi:MAG: isochorismatase [Chthoniobacteraceae bacterium]|nr:isochorismatase [Chthoniobacteraceae bacterium]
MAGRICVLPNGDGMGRARRIEATSKKAVIQPASHPFHETISILAATGRLSCRSRYFRVSKPAPRCRRSIWKGATVKIDKETLQVPAEPYEFEFLPGKTALLIIDMQRDFLEPGGLGEMLGNDVSQLRRTIAPNQALNERYSKT